jgi:hypothetical protein
VTCSGQTCVSGAANQCAGLGANCICNSDGPPGSPGTCGQPTTTTTTTTVAPPPPNTCPGGSCSTGSCLEGCACVSNTCVACVQPNGGACTTGQICCQTAALCPTVGDTGTGVCPGP